MVAKNHGIHLKNVKFTHLLLVSCWPMEMQRVERLRDWSTSRLELTFSIKPCHLSLCAPVCPWQTPAWSWANRNKQSISFLRSVTNSEHNFTSYFANSWETQSCPAASYGSRVFILSRFFPSVKMVVWTPYFFIVSSEALFDCIFPECWYSGLNSPLV